MRVVDTSAWIEWLLGTALGKRLEPELPPNDEWIVPTIVQYELMRAPIRALSRAQADTALAFSNKLAVRQLDIDLANRGGGLHGATLAGYGRRDHLRRPR